jgi:hypothetical protein
MRDSEADWQQAPDGVPMDEDLPAPHDDRHTPSLEERFMQAVKEQQLDYSQGKMPPQPQDETLNNGQGIQQISSG